MPEYSQQFFADLQDGAVSSAKVIVPLILGLVPAASVVDVGCGEGVWLAEFQRLGANDILGIDGDYVERQRLQVREQLFRAADLSKPLSLGRIFDLAVSLEVAEHLSPESAASFVESLTSLAPAVLFSAAIPFQGGNHHFNEQWPDFWGDLFRVHGYFAIDCIRPRVWSNPSVEWWYAQNAFLYVRGDLLEDNAALRAEYERSIPSQFRLVHPNQYLHLHGLYGEIQARREAIPGLRVASNTFAASLKNAIKWRLRWLRFGRSAERHSPGHG